MDSRMSILEADIGNVHEVCWDIKNADLKSLLRELVVYFFIVPGNFGVSFSGRNEILVSGKSYHCLLKVWKRGAFETAINVDIYESGLRDSNTLPIVKGVVFVAY